MQRARRARPGDHHDLVGAARDSRHERPHRGDARRHDPRHPRPRRRDAGARHGRWRSGRVEPRRRRRAQLAGRAASPRDVASRSRSRCWPPCSPSSRRRSSPRDNLLDLFLANLPVLIVALGMTLVDPHRPDRHLGRLDVRDLRRASRACWPRPGCRCRWSALGACAVGAAFGASTARSSPTSRIPSIVVTLATMVALREALRWATEGAWVQDLPDGFQWFGLTQAAYPFAGAGDRARCLPSRSPGACGTCRPAARSTPPDRTARRRGWPASITRASLRVFVVAGGADRTGRAAQRGPLQSDSRATPGSASS